MTSAAGTDVYTYDAENRMDTFTDGSTTASYEYDPFGKRLSKTVNGTTRYFLYDDEDILVEYDSSGNVVADYWHGQGIDEPVRMTRSSTDYYTFDGLGSVRDLTSASQVVQESYDYDAFGNIVSAPSTGNPYTYTSREYDPESGLYFYRARQYDPSIGRFLQADPIKFGGGVNWYTYAKNNPINQVDPYGKDCIAEGSVLIAMTIAALIFVVSYFCSQCGKPRRYTETIEVPIYSFPPSHKKPNPCAMICGACGTALRMGDFGAAAILCGACLVCLLTKMGVGGHDS